MGPETPENSQTLMGRIKAAVHEWWEGRYVPPGPLPPGLMMLGHQEWHWSARWARAGWGYFKEHHHWIIGLVVAAAIAIWGAARR